jgi:hypothetical protein
MSNEEDDSKKRKNPPSPPAALLHKDNEDDMESLVVQLLAVDPHQLAQVAKGNDKRKEQLVTFGNKLLQAINDVKVQERTDQIAAAVAKRRKLRASNQCFHCETSVDILSPCVGSHSKRGIGGDGETMLCEQCIASGNSIIATCSFCDKFFCQECDRSYTCTGCSESFCTGCAEDKHMCEDMCEGCCDIYCLSCADESLKQETCCGCYKSNRFCEPCGEQFPLCEGECGQPVCDRCLYKFRCGNDSRYCGSCEFDCTDCDICEGYY